MPATFQTSGQLQYVKWAARAEEMRRKGSYVVNFAHVPRQAFKSLATADASH